MLFPILSLNQFGETFLQIGGESLPVLIVPLVQEGFCFKNALTANNR